MKTKLTRLAALAALLLAGGVSQAQQYALHLRDAESPAIELGSTVTYVAEDWEMEFGLAAITFVIDNLTDQPLMTTQEVTLLEGPERLADIEICGGGSCPWNGEPYQLQPGSNPTYPLALDINTTGLGEVSALYSISIINAEDTSSRVTIYLRFNTNANGIGSVEISPVAVYPNPTTGKVTVGDTEFDLTGRPAGVYFLPYQGRAAKVIKL